MRRGNIVGLLALGGIGAYVLTLMAQQHAAEELCEQYSVGTAIDSDSPLQSTWLISMRGPIRVPEQPKARQFIFCSTLTMCDTSCTLVVEDRMVTQSRFSEL